MKLLVLLWCASVLQADAVRDNSTCAGPVIEGVHYTDEVLYPHEMVNSLDYDSNTNTLYFTTFTIPIKLVKIDLYTKELVYLGDDTVKPWSVVVDPQTSDLYVGNKGIYKYNATSDKLEYFAANETDIFASFFKDVLYFIDTEDHFVRKIVNGVISEFEDLKNTYVNEFVIDNDDFITYSDNGGLHGKKMGTKDLYIYKKTRGMYVRSVHMNTYGEVYVSLDDGVYTIDRQKYRLNKIFSHDGCRFIAFNLKNNLIFSDWSSVHRLVPSDDQDCV